MIVAALLLLLCGSNSPCAQFNDDFSGGLGNWQIGGAWFSEGSASETYMAVDTQSDEFAWNSVVALADSWVLETSFTFESLYNDGNWTGTAGMALANSQGQLLFLADVIYSQDAYLYPGMGYYTGQWFDVLDPNVWHPNAQNEVRLRLERPFNGRSLNYSVTCSNGFKQEYTSLPIPEAILNQFAKVGLRGFKSKIKFSYANVTTPLPPTVELAMYPGLTIRGDAGTTYALQYASFLESNMWTTLTNITLPSSSLILFDTTAQGAGRRFYRVVAQ